jgi:predicted dehydrogenase
LKNIINFSKIKSNDKKVGKIMSKIYTIAILGCGNRGGVYANYMNKLPDKFKVVALCDTRVDRLEHLRKTISITPDNLFTDENEFLKEKRADVLVIATWDKDHVRQCLRAMELGYDILLEKPISDSAEEVKALLDMQKKTNCKIAVCHVLRYAPAFKLLDEIIKSGKLGKLMERLLHIGKILEVIQMIRFHIQHNSQGGEEIQE